MAKGAFAPVGEDGCCKLVGLASESVYRKQMGYACSTPYFFRQKFIVYYSASSGWYRAVFARNSVNVVNSTTGPNRTVNHREPRQALKQVPYFVPPIPSPESHIRLTIYGKNKILFLKRTRKDRINYKIRNKWYDKLQINFDYLPMCFYFEGNLLF